VNGLKEVEVILESQAVMVANKNISQEKKQLLEKLLFRIRSVKKAKRSKYVLMNVPNKNLDQIIGLLPGMRSPTVLPLAESGWSSVHSVLSEDEFWDRIEKLRAAGAEGILVVPIEKLIL
jgi:ATP phosphoribosyltransferase